MTSGPREGQHKRGQMARPNSEGTPPGQSDDTADTKRLRAEYPVTLQRGQRKYGPPSQWEGPEPSMANEIFVSKIPKDMLEDDLVPIFQQTGPLYEVRLMMDTGSLSKGHAYVKYCTESDKDAALARLNGYEIRPSVFLNATKSAENNRIFIGNVPKSFTTGDLQRHMIKLTNGVKKVILYPCVNDRAKNRGYGFVEYETHQQASAAREKLMVTPTLVSGHEIKVDWAEPELMVDEEVMKKVKVLYVRNLELNTSEHRLIELFSSKGGHIERLRKLQDYAFIHFATREQAETAMESFQGKEIDGCVIDINWSKPVTNKEEYHQRKAMSKAMYRGPNAPLATGMTFHGEPFLLNQRLRTTASSQGLGPKHIFNKLKQCETPLTAVHPTLIAPNNLLTCNVTMKNPLEMPIGPTMPYSVDKIPAEDVMGQNVQDIVAQQAMQASFMGQPYLVPAVAPTWNNQATYTSQMHPGQNFVHTPYMVQPTYPVFDATYQYACPQFYPPHLVGPVPGLNNNALSLCNDAYTPR